MHRACDMHVGREGVARASVIADYVLHVSNTQLSSLIEA